MDQPIADFQAAVSRALTDRSVAGTATESGMPRDAIRNVLLGHDPRVSRADEICRAVGITFTLGLPRDDPKHPAVHFEPARSRSKTASSPSCWRASPTTGRPLASTTGHAWPRPSPRCSTSHAPRARLRYNAPSNTSDGALSTRSHQAPTTTTPPADCCDARRSTQDHGHSSAAAPCASCRLS